MKILGIITARKNSKRVKNKNKKLLGSKPLIQYTFDIVKKIDFLSNTILSTDDEDIFRIGKKNKIITPWLRPKSLAKDNTSSYKVVMHAYQWYKKNYSDVDAIALFQPTSPFRKLKTINYAYDVFKENLGLKSVVTVSFYKKKIFFKKNIKKISMFCPNGLIFLNPVKELKKYKSFMTEKTIPVAINDKTETTDIDYPADWKKAEKVVKKFKLKLL